MILLIRYLLSIALCYGVYTETGPWTTLFAVLVIIGSEALGYILKQRGTGYD